MWLVYLRLTDKVSALDGFSDKYAKACPKLFSRFFLAWIRYISFFEILLADCCSKNKWSFCELRKNSEVISNQNRMINNNHNTLTWYFSFCTIHWDLIFIPNKSFSLPNKEFFQGVLFCWFSSRFNFIISQPANHKYTKGAEMLQILLYFPKSSFFWQMCCCAYCLGSYPLSQLGCNGYII